MNSYEIMSFLDHEIGSDEYNEFKLCTISELSSIDFGHPYSYIVIFIPANINQNIGHFVSLMVDRSNQYHHYSQNPPLAAPIFFDPFGKSPYFYSKNFPIECDYDEHFSFVMPHSKSCGYHVMRYMYISCNDFGSVNYCDDVGRIGRTIDRNVQKEMKDKMKDVTVKPTLEKLYLPGVQQDILDYFNNREE